MSTNGPPRHWKERTFKDNYQRKASNKLTVFFFKKRDNSRLSEFLFALRMYRFGNGKSPYEQYVGVEPMTIKKLIMNRKQTISVILVRERVRGRKLERNLRTKNAKVYCWNYANIQ